jgi:hypothetical protein
VAWLPPEADDGAEPELKPLEPEEFELDPEFDELEPEPVEPEPDELEPDEPEPDEEFDEPEPDEVPDEPEPDEVPDEPEPDEVPDEPDEAGEEVSVLCVDPGRARATAPAVTTLARVTAVVVERTLARPCSLAAMARRTRSRYALLMYLILRSRTRNLLDESSRLAMRPSGRSDRPG